MATLHNHDVRVLLPCRPNDSLRDVVALLSAVLPPRRTHVRSLYVHRPVEADFFMTDAYARFTEVAQLELEAENATRFEAQLEMVPLESAGFEVSADVIRGTPVEGILAEANVWKADLVAVRTRSLAARDHRIGGMASALLYHSMCPVITHHAVPEDYRLSRILIPTDFSRGSARSLDWGLALAAITGAEPILLHVVSAWNHRLGITQDELTALAAQELDRLRLRANATASIPVDEARVVAAPTPAEGILGFAEEEHCSLVVLSATGASAMRAILVGANTRKVVRASSCPVFVVPASNRVSVEGFLAKARPVSRPKRVEAARAAAGEGGSR